MSMNMEKCAITKELKELKKIKELKELKKIKKLKELKKMIMKKVVLMAMMIATGMCAKAQEGIETSIGADVVSQYIWRGQD